MHRRESCRHFSSNDRFVALQKYRITKRVGGGSFGDIYLGVGANGEKVGREKSLASPRVMPRSRSNLTRLC